jgi:peptidoglycan/LPS O-acetylase OafA/YrhL
MLPELRPTAPANKLLGLEVLRFLAALTILVFHYRHFGFIADKPVDLANDRLPLYGLLHFFYDAEPYGVWVFWCISGFIFFWKYRDAIADRSIDGWTFFVLRLSRLYPLHLMTLLLVAILQPIYFGLNGDFFVYQENNLRHFLLQIFMASNWGFQSGHSFDGPSWSISIEVLVYVCFFFMLLVTRSWLLNLAVIVGCFNGSGQIAVCFAFFYIGGLAAVARRAIASTRFRLAAEGVAWLAVGIFTLAIWSFAGDPLKPIAFPLLLTYTPMMLFCISRDIAMPAPIQRAVEAAGNMTYSSYLLQFPIQLMIVLGFAIARTPVPLYDETFFWIFIATTLLASYLVYRYFELPAQNLVRELLLRPRAVISTAHG